MEDQRFANHWKLGRAEFVFAVMADEQMLHDSLELRRKAFNLVDRTRNRFEFHDDVTEQLARRGVADGALVAEFFEFADIVQNRSGEKQIEVELRIVSGYCL